MAGRTQFGGGGGQCRPRTPDIARSACTLAGMHTVARVVLVLRVEEVMNDGRRMSETRNLHCENDHLDCESIDPGHHREAHIACVYSQSELCD